MAPPEAARHWAALQQQIFEIDPLVCPTCHGAMRIVAFITRASVIDQILAHLRTHARRPRPRLPHEYAEPPAPLDDARTGGVGGGPNGASDRSPLASSRHGNRRSHGARGAGPSQSTHRRPSSGAHGGGELAVFSTNPDRNSYSDE